MKRRKREVVSAKAGEKWDVLFPGPVGKVVKVEIQKPCTQKTNGHWYCQTHYEHFSHQLMKDFHIAEGFHRLIWICHEHGPEEP